MQVDQQHSVERQLTAQHAGCPALHMVMAGDA